MTPRGAGERVGIMAPVYAHPKTLVPDVGKEWVRH